MADSAYLRGLRKHAWSPHFPWETQPEPEESRVDAPVSPPEPPSAPDLSPAPQPATPSPVSGAKPRTPAPAPAPADPVDTLDTANYLERLSLETMEEAKSARQYLGEKDGSWGGPSDSDIRQYMIEDAGPLKEQLSAPVFAVGPDGAPSAVAEKVRAQGIDPRRVRTFDQIKRDVAGDLYLKGLVEQIEQERKDAPGEYTDTVRQAARKRFDDMVEQYRDALTDEERIRQSQAERKNIPYSGPGADKPLTSYQLRQAFSQAMVDKMAADLSAAITSRLLTLPAKRWAQNLKK